MAKKTIVKDENLMIITISTQSGEVVEHTITDPAEAYKFASENGYQVSIN